jgi:hypothetical protein
MTGTREPSGAAPPAAVYVGGTAIQLAPVADLICSRYRVEFPDERGRYGDAGEAWCRHDNQWLLSWAVNDVLGATDLGEQVQWLARVLHARDFPVARLARDLEIAAEVVVSGALGYVSKSVAARLLQAAQTVREVQMATDPSPAPGG